MNVNDIVTRYSHHHDIMFRIYKIENGIAYLKGKNIRLIADALIIDLKKVNNVNEENIPYLDNALLRQNTVPGVILHIDGDEHYLKKAMQAYKEYNVQAIGCFINEEDIPFKIKALLLKHHPDIVVITGHDALEGKAPNDINSYRHSLDFVKSVLEARNYQSNKDSLVIIAGACQSYYEALLKAGANVASSPTRDNIHLLDPVIIATLISKTSVSEYAAIKEIINSTITKRLGGIETKGVARKIYLGGR